MNNNEIRCHAHLQEHLLYLLYIHALVFSYLYHTLKGTLFDVVLLMWVNGRLLFLSTFCQGRRFDSAHQHRLFFSYLNRHICNVPKFRRGTIN